MLRESAKNTAIAEKREENPEILTNVRRKRLTRLGKVDHKWRIFYIFDLLYPHFSLDDLEPYF